MATSQLQTPIQRRRSTFLQMLIMAIEGQLEKERERLALWLPVLFGVGIILFFLIPTQNGWLAALFIMLGLCCIGLMLSWQRRSGRALTIGAAALFFGLVYIWARAILIAAPVLPYPTITEFSAQVETVQLQSARAKIRFLLRPIGREDLPPRIAVSAPLHIGEGVKVGEYIGIRARLSPPPKPNLPGGYDFARRAWFEKIGAVGSIMGEIARAAEEDRQAKISIRASLTGHIHARVAGDSGGIAAALVTGDRGAISDDVEEAMRRSGLAHLLSISGLHVTAVIGFSMLASLRIFGLFQNFALAGRVLPAAAATAALVGGCYTLLAGAEVPTLRSFIASLLLLAAILLGREAITLRLVAAGAALVLLWRPEAVVGPSFQLSFAAVATIVALHELPIMKKFLSKRDEAIIMKAGRNLAALIVTGMAIEVALMPIALFHFHKSGLYGALANMIAIPLTTFIIMPAIALALFFDLIGAGSVFWWIAAWNIDFKINLASWVANSPGAVRTLPEMPPMAFGLFMAGGLWLFLWSRKWRIWGIYPIILAIMILIFQPKPDLIVSRSGQQIAARVDGDQLAFLRQSRTGFARNMLLEAGGSDLEPMNINDLDKALCNDDFCRWQQSGGTGRIYQILASRSSRFPDYKQLIDACAYADIVVSDRTMPKNCRPKYLLLDRQFLEERGGAIINLGQKPVFLSRSATRTNHPWNEAGQLSRNIKRRE